MRSLARIAPVLAPLALACALLLAGPADEAAANGCSLKLNQGVAGTEADPILVANRNALELLAMDPSCYAGSDYVFRQTADIDLADAAWTPIANGGAFDGTYDGAGHRITGLRIEGVASGSGVGLFSTASGAVIRDLTLVAPIVSDARGVPTGAVVGDAALTEITGVRVIGGRVSGLDTVGGIAGGLCDARVATSGSSAEIAGTLRAGGLVGASRTRCVNSLGGGVSVQVPAPTFAAGIFDSAASGAVSGSTRLGGLVGLVTGGSIVRSAASGAVTAADLYAGGLVGSLNAGYGPVSLPADDGVVEDVYATGAVTAATGAGGLVGVADPATAFTRAYATGRVTAEQDAGGLVGAALVSCTGVGASICSAEVGARAATAAFWDVETTGRTTSADGFGAGRTTAQLQAIATYADAGWSITRGYSASTTWAICPTANGGYPFLTSAYTASTQPCAGTPDAPNAVVMRAGDGRITLSWKPPAGDGGTPVTGYTATATTPGRSGRATPSCAVAATKRSCTISGLRNGRSYRISLTADNLEGAGTAVVRTVTPRRSLVVLSSRRSGLAVITRVRVRGPGRLTQVGTAPGLRAAVCRTSRVVRRARVLELRCALDPTAVDTLAERALRIRVVTRLQPQSGVRRSAARVVAFARTGGAGPVTG